MNVVMSVIEVNELTKYYGKVRGIEDVSFQVEEGEIFGFIGPMTPIYIFRKRFNGKLWQRHLGSEEQCLV